MGPMELDGQGSLRMKIKMLLWRLTIVVFVTGCGVRPVPTNIPLLPTDTIPKISNSLTNPTKTPIITPAITNTPLSSASLVPTALAETKIQKKCFTSFRPCPPIINIRVNSSQKANCLFHRTHRNISKIITSNEFHFLT